MCFSPVHLNALCAHCPRAQILDFLVVVSAWVTILIDLLGDDLLGADLSTMRSLRAARPLRQVWIHSVPSVCACVCVPREDGCKIVSPGALDQHTSLSVLCELPC